MIDYVYLIPLVPLVVSIIVLLVGKEGPKSLMPLLSIAAMGFCWLSSMDILYWAFQHPGAPAIARWDWFTVGNTPFQIGTFIDGSAAFMLFVVTTVAFLVQVYSLGYMHGEARFKRFYAYLGFFTASMLGLVVSSSLLTVFACWELMGLSSYLLIGFWFEKPSAAYAAKKAFITTKLGDLGMYLGLLLLFKYTETFDLPQMAAQVSQIPGYLPGEVATWVGLLLLAGAVGKSAQFPLFIWLPDAMEGPTPVSALIHAATMVAAGIFLVARCYFLYAMSHDASMAVAWVGLITAFMAATMAVVAYDLKRVLAFSTVSQLGFMMLALGVGPAGYTAGLFHLVTHAFFKALLFLGAGSVIHAMHTNDMRQMGGLSKQMMSTCITMLIATAAIIGFPGLSGWFSKEAILAAVYEQSPFMWAVALFTAGLTTFYMCRMFFLTFVGSGRDHEKWLHAHESPATMTVPLWILAVLAAGTGWFLESGHRFATLVHFGAPEGHPQESPLGHAAAEVAHAVAEAVPHAAAAAHAHPWFLVPAALSVLVLGMAGAWHLYGRDDFKAAESLKSSLMPLFTLLERRYGLDDFFLLLVRGSDILAQICYWIDENVIDRLFVDFWGMATLVLAEIQSYLDTVFVDGAVDAFGTGTVWSGSVLRGRMTGQVQEYLLYVSLAVTLFAMIVFGY